MSRLDVWSMQNNISLSFSFYLKIIEQMALSTNQWIRRRVSLFGQQEGRFPLSPLSYILTSNFWALQYLRIMVDIKNVNHCILFFSIQVYLLSKICLKFSNNYIYNIYMIHYICALYIKISNKSVIL